MGIPRLQWNQEGDTIDKTGIGKRGLEYLDKPHLICEAEPVLDLLSVGRKSLFLYPVATIFGPTLGRDHLSNFIKTYLGLYLFWVNHSAKIKRLYLCEKERD